MARNLVRATAAADEFVGVDDGGDGGGLCHPVVGGHSNRPSNIRTLVGYVIIRHKLPYVTVTYAHLESLHYYQYGQMATLISLGITATNDNAKAHASFDDVSFLLRLHGVLIGRLRVEPFEVPKNRSITLPYSVPSSMVPSDEGARVEMGAYLQQGRASFLLKVDSRTRWKVGILGSVRFWTHLSCKLNFATANGSSIYLHCSSKPH